MREELSKEFIKRNLNEIDDILRDSGVTYGILGRTTDHGEDEQFIQTETIVPLAHDSFEKLMTINSPFQMKEHEKVEFQRAPNIGENTFEVLLKLGYSDEEIKSMKENGSVHYPEN